ncbi:MAG: hypothetical protein HY822_23810 [Acidobacteria bacterium]|nr:hypothetical protein [Acidobacteriota bacterium]
MSTNYPNPNPNPYPGQYPGQMPPKKKTSPWVWVAVGVGAFIMIIVLVVVAGAFFVWYKVKQAGLDPELMKKNPALAVSKLVAATNPNVEVLGVDDSKGIIRVREKSSGKIMTLNFEDAKQGRFVFQEEGKDAVVVKQTGEGEVKVSSAEGTMTFRQGAGKTPGWAPVYPGATMEGNVSMQGGEGESGSFHFTTKDSADKVVAFYESALKSAGMKVTSNLTREGGSNTGGMVMGQDDAKNRNVMATIGTGDQGTTVNVVFSTKN